MFINLKLSLGHHNKFYDYENNTKYMQKPNNQ